MSSAFAADLDALMARLNSEQRAAVTHSSNTAVLAGPGSGKTDTTVLKVARLLYRDVNPPRGVACLTYGNDAVQEFTLRLRHLGLRAGQRLFLGTVHSFCLNRVLRPFAAIAGRPELARPRVLPISETRRLMETALGASGLSEQPERFEPTLTTIRRARACGLPLEPFDERHIEVADTYESALADHQAIDFEGIILEALRIIDDTRSVRDLIVARFPWLAIDEYQDLGAPLHHIVLQLHSAGCNIFAVGDPDQCILGFTGADPTFLSNLAERPDFRAIRLQFNYRSGARLIAAAEASLGVPRNYKADPARTDGGEIIFDEVQGGLPAQASRVIHEIVPNFLQNGYEPHNIAILYKQKGPLADALNAEISATPQQYLIERDARFPTTPIVRWLQHCATRAVRGIDAHSLADLAAPYRDLLERAGTFDTELATRRRLLEALEPVEPDQVLEHWITAIDDRLRLSDLVATGHTRPDDLDTLTALRQPRVEPVTLADFAQGVQMAGRVVLTNYHASKGRQFDVVILPGLQATLFPYAYWKNGKYWHPPGQLAEDRRLFYVGLTRARHRIVLVYSPQFTNKQGYYVVGHSPFVDEVAQRLAH